MNELYFIRHGHHIAERGQPIYSGLTRIGCDEARSLSALIPDVTPNMQACSVNSRRAMATIALALFPDTPNESIDRVIDTLCDSGILRTDSDLAYHTIGADDKDFDQAMNHAFINREALRFFVNKSDAFIRDGSDISTYSTMSHVIINKILSATKPIGLYCAREFFVPSFRAYMTGKVLGASALNHYVDYYCSEVEWKPEARTRVTKIFHDKGVCVLEDAYGLLEFSLADILNMQRSVS